MRRVTAAVVTLFVATATACGDVVGPATRALPPDLWLRATAEGFDAGLDIQCAVNGLVRLEQQITDSADHRVQHGSGGGEALRALQRPDESGIQFWGEYYVAALQVHQIAADSIEIRDIGQYDDGVPSRFWTELLVFRGHRTPDESNAGVIARGTWTCYPMDTPPSSGDYYDPVGTVVGTWTLSRQAS